MDASTRFDTQAVGALPVIVEYLERLQVAKTIDRLIPWQGEVRSGRWGDKAKEVRWTRQG